MSHSPTARRTVGEIVAEDYRRAPVLKRHGIDFCCGGGISLERAAERAGVSLDVLEHDLLHPSGTAASADLRVEDWEPGFLAQFIVNQHHRFVRAQVPALLAFTQKVARVHGELHPETAAIAERFARVAEELECHMAREEAELFPAIMAGAPAEQITALVDEMEADHEGAGALMREIRQLSRDYAPPAGACATYRAAYANLEAFEEDLHRHVHLENNVLFPKALATGSGPPVADSL